MFINKLDSSIQSQPVEPDGAAAHTLRLPGKNLYLTPLLKAKKFRNFGYRAGAMAAFEELQEAKLGTLEEIGAGKGSRSASVIIILNLISYYCFPS